MLNVARLADVSVGTVFNVLNNTVPVRAVTREKVEAAIRTLNFQPTTLTLPPIKHVDPLVHAQNVNVPQLIVVGAASVDYTATLSGIPSPQ